MLIVCRGLVSPSIRHIHENISVRKDGSEGWLGRMVRKKDGSEGWFKGTTIERYDY